MSSNIDIKTEAENNSITNQNVSLSTKQTKTTPKPEKKKKLRCAMCNKKLGLLGFECKCGKMYCSTHLLAELHNCTHNYKEEQCEKLEKRLIKVVNQKVPAM